MRIRPLSAPLLAMLLLLPYAASAQRVTLDGVDSLLATGQIAQARAALLQWKQRSEARASNAARARAAFLGARLASRADSAEDAYLVVALSHPTSPYAAESLLRLGQARLANGDARQALVYLQRMLTDYPRSEHRAAGTLWLARAQAAAGSRTAACNTVDSGLRIAQTDSETAALLRAEHASACAADKISAAPAPTPTTSRKAERPGREAASSSRARFAIQIGAFRQRSGAYSAARQLAKAGFENVRIVIMPENSLLRVRVGSYESSAAAAIDANRLKAKGFTAIVVADRQREKPARE